MIRKLLQRLKTRKLVTTFDVYTVNDEKYFVKIK